MQTITWNGTLVEQLALRSAVEHNCTCTFNGSGVRVGFCSAHIMLRSDQRALNGLLWDRHLAKRRLAEEGITAP